jgi:uncharacterized protein (TIGR02145 family)
MKSIFLFACILSVNLNYAQSKKEQIANLSKHLDSVLLILTSERIAHEKEIKKANEKISALEEQIRTNKSIQFGSQNWMGENLSVSTFRNGDIIPQAQSNEAWEEAGFNKQAAWCYYNISSDSLNIEVKNYGKYYNSYALNDPRGLAPEGWRLPTKGDWATLENQLFLSEKNLIDAFSSEGWTNGFEGSNTIGLNFQAGGWRDVGYGGLGEEICFWAYQSPVSQSTPYVSLFFDENLPCPYSSGRLANKSTSWIMGFNVRCIRE